MGIETNKRNSRARAILKDAKQLARDVQKGKIYDVKISIVQDEPKPKAKAKAVKSKDDE